MIDPDLLLHGYRLGVFPMAMEDGEIRWFSPDPRTILPLDGFHIPHGLKRERRARPLEIRINTRFEEVIRVCAAREDTWINQEIVESYLNLHSLGWSHSVEAWWMARWSAASMEWRSAAHSSASRCSIV
jgi:leucyl/phenylalanyl-tRNA--protein transferase